MPRYKLTIEYDGGGFCGWQRQKSCFSVQEAVEEVIFALCQERVNVFAAGRTDAGVHALEQIVHLDLKKNWTDYRLSRGLNAHLQQRGYAVTILKSEQVAENFHARFDAQKRHYVYRIINRRSPPALDKGRLWWIAQPLSVEAMHEAAQVLVGKHDFTTFRSTMCQARSPIRHLERLDVLSRGPIIEIYASARSFLHNQIRSFVGSLKDVGTGRLDRSGLEQVLLARDRRFCGMVAPPHGLYFLRVDY